MKTIFEIAEKYGLKVIDTTSEMSGYPKITRKAVIGFDSWKQINDICEKENIAKEHIFSLEKKDGWDFWYRSESRNRPYNMIDIYSDDCYCSIYTSGEDEVKRFFENEVIEYAKGFDLCDDADIFFAEMKKREDIKIALENMDDDDFMLLHHDYSYEIMPQTAMSFDDDSKSYEIGLLFDNEK